ncbi:DNA replication factor Cdt1 [Rhinoraja longicauda]
MAQARLTDYFPQTKKTKRETLRVKEREVETAAANGSFIGVAGAAGSVVREGGQSRRRKVTGNPPAATRTRTASGDSPPLLAAAPVVPGGDVCESVPAEREGGWATPVQEAGRAVTVSACLVTPSRDGQTAAGCGAGWSGPGAEPGPGSGAEPGSGAAAGGDDGPRTRSANKRRRSHSSEEAPGPQRAPSARRCLVLQPQAATTRLLQNTSSKQTASPPPRPEGPGPTDASAHGATITRKRISKCPSLEDSSKRSQQTETTPGKESLLSLKSRLQRIRNLNQAATSLAPAALSTDAKSRLKRVRELGLKVQENKECKRTAGPDEESSVGERVKAPAYQRFHNLAQDVPPGLTLPFKYKVLAEMFRSMDTVVSMLFNRSETVTFAKVKQGAQDMMRKRFEQQNIGQIKTVYPSAYKFRQEKGIPTWSDAVKKSIYQLTIDPVFEGEENSEGQTHLTASRLLLRRQIFSRNLTNLVKQHHKAFLASLHPPMHVPDNKLTRWHPRFNVDEVPDVVAAELPLPPDFEKLTTAQEVLDKARSMMTPKMEKALANMALKSVETAMAATIEQKELNVVSPHPSPSSALKGVSQSLLERIRTKEAQNIQAAMTRNPAQTERLRMMTRLPEITRILRNVFVAEKKAALNIAVACNKVVDSYRSSMHLGDMEKHVRLLANIVPDWLSIHIIRKEVYLKLIKNVELCTVVEKIEKKIKDEERA